MEALLTGTIDEHDKKIATKRPRGWEKRFRGRDFTGEGADIIVDGNDRGKIKKQKQWEKDLHQQRYREALDFVLAKRDKMTVFTLLTTLRYRSALRASLEGRDEITLQPIMRWVYLNISSPTFVPICVEVAMNIMDLYSKHLSQSLELAKQTEKLHQRIKEEVERAQLAGMTRGMLEMLTPEVAG
jgi:U3 small nucleolar RNA-associated protein 15